MLRVYGKSSRRSLLFSLYKCSTDLMIQNVRTRSITGEASGEMDSLKTQIRFPKSAPRVFMIGSIGMTELTLQSDFNRSQRESFLLAHSLTRSLLLIIRDIKEYVDILSKFT